MHPNTHRGMWRHSEDHPAGVCLPAPSSFSLYTETMSILVMHVKMQHLLATCRTGTRALQVLVHIMVVYHLSAQSQISIVHCSLVYAFLLHLSLVFRCQERLCACALLCSCLAHNKLVWHLYSLDVLCIIAEQCCSCDSDRPPGVEATCRVQGRIRPPLGLAGRTCVPGESPAGNQPQICCPGVAQQVSLLPPVKEGAAARRDKSKMLFRYPGIESIAKVCVTCAFGKSIGAFAPTKDLLTSAWGLTVC